jgi:signal transduction histidine kinase
MYSAESDVVDNLAAGFIGSESGPNERKCPATYEHKEEGKHEDLFRRLRQRERELDAARLVSESLFHHFRLDELVEQALRTALDVVDAEAGSVLLANSETKQLVFHHSIGQSPVPCGTKISWGYGIAGAVFRSEKAEIIPDVKRDGRHFPGIDLEVGYTTRDMITLPLKRWKGDAIGVLNVLNKRHDRFSEEDLAILSILSAMTSTAIEQARLVEEAKRGEMLCLLGDIGHDVKNMLDPVVMGVGLLQEGLDEICVPSSHEQKQGSRDRCHHVIEVIRSSSRRLQERMRQMAECVKGISSKPHFAPCRLSSVVRSAMTTLGLVAEEQDVVLRSEGLEDLPAIIADEHRLYNAFYNLINNAIPEVHSGGSITVRGRAGAARIVLSVTDTGRGMPPEVRDSLFTGHAISRKPGGIGLGTKIVKDAVEAHGGTITVTSTVGIGTTFEIRLPLFPPQSIRP